MKFYQHCCQKTRGAILQHGAILLDWDGQLHAGSMGLPDDASLRPHVTTLRDEVGREIPRSVLEETVVEAFTEDFGVAIEPGRSSEGEHEREGVLIESFLVDG